MRKKRDHRKKRDRKGHLQRFVMSNLTRRVLREDIYERPKITMPLRTYRKIKLLKRDVNRIFKLNKPPEKKKVLRETKFDMKIKLDKRKVCKERSDRRRALFRMGRAGSGSAGPAKKWMTLKSRIRCK